MNIIESTYKWAYTPGTRKTTTDLILHHAAASNVAAQTIHQWHLNNGWAGIAYHYYVTKGGSVYRGRPENWLGGHTTNYNSCSIGICFEGNFDNDVMTAAQREAGAELVADIKKRYPGINVGKHGWYNATACPGKNFPFDEIVSGKTTEPVEDNAESKEPSEWAKEACQKAVESGLFIGNGNGDYMWQENLTREMMAVLLDRLGLINTKTEE